MTGCVIWGDVLNEGIWFMMELVLEVDVVYEGMWYMRGCGIWWDVVYEGMWYMRGCCIRGGNPRTFVPKMSEIKTLLLSNCRAKMTTQWLQCWRTLQISTVITRWEDYSCERYFYTAFVQETKQLIGPDQVYTPAIATIQKVSQKLECRRVHLMIQCCWWRMQNCCYLVQSN